MEDTQSTVLCAWLLLQMEQVKNKAPLLPQHKQFA